MECSSEPAERGNKKWPSHAIAKRARCNTFTIYICLAHASATRNVDWRRQVAKSGHCNVGKCRTRADAPVYALCRARARPRYSKFAKSHALEGTGVPISLGTPVRHPSSKARKYAPSSKSSLRCCTPVPPTTKARRPNSANSRNVASQM